MKYRLAGWLSLLACSLLGLAAEAWGQNIGADAAYMPAYSPGWSAPGGMPPPGMMGPGMPPGMMGGPGMGPGGPGGVMPAGYQDMGGYAGMGGMAAEDQVMTDAGPYSPGDDSCYGAMRGGLLRRGLLKNGCGCAGCRQGGGCHGLLGDCVPFRFFRFLWPEDDGGACAVRWFDVAADFVYWTRDQTGADQVFARRGIGPGAPIALGTQQLDFDFEPGFRILANLQVGAGSSVEFGYVGTFSHATSATTVSPQNALTSIMSNFATNPAGGFVETDFTHRQTLQYSSDLDSFEANYRRRWVSPECRWQGSWLVGARYISFNDDLLYETRGRGVQADFLTNTNNSLTGAQLGGDVWLTLVPGLRIGAEGKVGLYGNYSHAGTRITSTLPFNYVEDLQSTDAAFVGELNLHVLYRLSYSWTLRAGYNFLVMEGVALATDNFNSVAPNGFSQGAVVQNRVPFIINNSDVLFHGMHVGAEYMW